MKKALVLFMVMIFGVLFASNLLANNDIVYGQVYHWELVIVGYTGPHHMIPIFEYIKVPNSYFRVKLQVKYENIWYDVGYKFCDFNGNYYFSLSNEDVDSDFIRGIICENGFAEFRLVDLYGNPLIGKRIFEWNENHFTFNIDIEIK